MNHSIEFNTALHNIVTSDERMVELVDLYNYACAGGDERRAVGTWVEAYLQKDGVRGLDDDQIDRLVDRVNASVGAKWRAALRV
jgi:hypothetical protein